MPNFNLKGDAGKPAAKPVSESPSAKSAGGGTVKTIVILLFAVMIAVAVRTFGKTDHRLVVSKGMTGYWDTGLREVDSVVRPIIEYLRWIRRMLSNKPRL